MRFRGVPGFVLVIVCVISFGLSGFGQQDLLKLHGIFIDYGEKEESSHIRLASGLFSRLLSERNIPHVFEVYPLGDHNSRVRQPLENRVFRSSTKELISALQSNLM